MKPQLWNVLKRFYSIDTKLRQYPFYRSISIQVVPRVRAVLTGKAPAENWAAVDAFLENYGKINVDENAILFESYWGKKIAGHPLALFREFIQRPNSKNFKIYWTLQAGVPAPSELKNHPNVEFIDPTSRRYGRALLASKYLINNTTFPSYFVRSDEQVYCNTWHGIPMKAMGRDMNAPLVSMANSQRNFLQASILPISSPFYSSSILAPYYIENLVSENILEIGSPGINDVLLPKLSNVELRSKYGISPHQKIIVLALTWRGNSLNIKDCYLEHHKLFCDVSEALGDDYFVLFSTHQMVKSKVVEKNVRGAVLEANENINDILAYADCLVSDYSSIVFDFLLKDCPTILYVPDLDEYLSERGLYVEPQDLPCATVTNLTGVVQSIQKAKKPSDFGNHTETLEKFLPYETGNVSAKIIAQMFEETPKSTTTMTPPKKTKILIAPGGLVPNGITTSLKNLLSNFDYETYEPFVLIAAEITESELRRKSQFMQFDPRINWILWCGPNHIKDDEKVAYRKYMAGTDTLADDEQKTLDGYFERECRRTLGGHQFDIAIEFAGYSPFWTGLILKSNSKKKVIYQHNNLWAEATNPNASRNQKPLLSVFGTYKSFDLIAAVSDETRDVNIKNLNDFYSDSTEIKTVRNTLDLDRIKSLASVPVVFCNTTVAAILDEPDVTAFIALGRLSPEKRFDRLIQAFSKIVANNPKAVLFICGSGPLHKELDALITTLSLTSHVYLLGQVPNPYSLMSRCNFCVMSSDYEGQPMVLLEAIALQVPCIGTDIPGIRSVLKNNVGTLVPASEAGLVKGMQDGISGRLPAPSKISTDNYVSETMSNFYSVVCSR
jgi:CDP-glycerol glycerophosphotransferase